METIGDPTGDRVAKLVADLESARRDLAPIVAVAEAQRQHWRQHENAISYTLRVLSETSKP